MGKTSTLSIQVDTAAKEQAEQILSRLGMPVSTAVNIFLNQIRFTGKIPFEISLPALPMAPPEMDADLMTKEEFFADMEEAAEEAEAGDHMDVDEAFSKLLKGQRDEAV